MQQELLGKCESGKMLKTRDTEDEHKRLVDFRTSERNLEQVLRSLDPPRLPEVWGENLEVHRDWRTLTKIHKLIDI